MVSLTFLNNRAFLWSSHSVCGINSFVVLIRRVLAAFTFESQQHFLIVLLCSMDGGATMLICVCLASSFSFLSLICSYSDPLHFRLFRAKRVTLTFSVAKLVQAVFCKYQVPYSLNFFKNFLPSVPANKNFSWPKGEIIR